MQVLIGNQAAEFRPWCPQFGRVFESTYTFDSETTRIDELRPWITPAYVLGAAFDGQRGYFITRECVEQFLALHNDLHIVMHNAPFDLAVLNLLAPGAQVYELVENNQIWDTQLLHRLYMLGTEGHTAAGKGQSTLEQCADRYLGIILPKSLCDSEGDDVRLSYSKWLNKRPHEIEPVYLEYLAKDVFITYNICQSIGSRIQAQPLATEEAFGVISTAMTAQQSTRWGWQTHHIQLRAAIALKAISANGLCIDLDRRDELSHNLDCAAAECSERLRRYGYLPGQAGSGKALQEIMRQLERRNPTVSFPRTPKATYATNREALEELAASEPFVRDLLDFKAIQKLRSSFLGKMGQPRLHPSFDVLCVSGRTSSFGAINAQNLPRDERVRSCFVPSPGNVFIDADYATLELATLAQSVMSQFQLHSEMAVAINAGQDLHRLVAARVTAKCEANVTDDERQKAKPINFGKPGGMGDDGLKRYAKASYGVDLTDTEVSELSDSWFGIFPEMQSFLFGEREWGKDTARYFDLTPQSFLEHTGSRSFLDHPSNYGRESVPHPILGAMCLKVLKEPGPKRQNGVEYAAAEVDYFWARVQEKLNQLPPENRQAIIAKQPSVQLQRAVQRFVDKSPCMTLTGRLRAKASFCARHNTLFQGLAADGAKLALWRLWRAGYRIVNFVHDEVLVEVPENSNLREQADGIRGIMIDAMREVVPDVRIEVEYAATRRWHKKAKAILDEAGQLVIWTPNDQQQNMQCGCG